MNTKTQINTQSKTAAHQSAKIKASLPLTKLVFLSKNHKDVIDLIQKQSSLGKAIVVCASSGFITEKIILILKTNYKIHSSHVSNISQVVGGKIHVGQVAITDAFECNGIMYIPDRCIVKAEALRSTTKQSSSQKISYSYDFNKGDLVVHRKYGIGMFDGLETVKVHAIQHECLRLVYANQNKLYVPVEHINLIAPYRRSNGEDSTLDTLGGKSWTKTRASAKSKIQELAHKIIAIATKRQLSKGNIYDIAMRSPLINKLESSFPYIETEDQMQAIHDIYSDLESGKIVDRLICGDVGFGKTEVAVRAMFVVLCGKLLAQSANHSAGASHSAGANNSVDANHNAGANQCANMSSKLYGQVAMLCPTTFLAKQHYHTLCGRFAEFGFKIALLSRFTTATERREIEKGIASGEVDIVVGTHAILNSSIIFKNLQMVICDEEQSFGVGQKEKLKHNAPNAHYITLSATPIPRTLYMSLCGVRDISIIGTPPIGRKPIKNSMIMFSERLIKEIVDSETARMGQVIIITPRISDIVDIEQMIIRSCPDRTFAIMHGKCNPDVLDNTMEEFADGKFDILIATTIIATGMDFGNSNTIIINRAEMFGLSSLYQIQGRVGRRDKQAYCYFLVNQKVLDDESKSKKLAILQNMGHFGSGIEIAHLDLDARGGGNLLGDEQSGNIDSIGIDLYYEFLNEAIAQTKAAKGNNEEGEAADFVPEVSIGKSIYIPVDYISSTRLRMEIYRKISNASSTEDAMDIKAELINRFGDIPPELMNLFEIIEIKILCKKHMITKLHKSAAHVLITLGSQAKISLAKLMQLISSNKNVTLQSNDTVKITLKPKNTKPTGAKQAGAKQINSAAKLPNNNKINNNGNNNNDEAANPKNTDFEDFEVIESVINQFMKHVAA